ncbi:MAG: hypothetical protein K8F52_09470 [Candidatus Scalindua rubra]|uniref:Uncharacterized protein n=1 Tax=Candidatus Scalindua brodae TaxID=237368 RepID=A0A0B0EHU4_9BACT|nr:MAG: hypothetical protein SCABRO_03579 [Candidatus Scalindua brodae]MBZ0108888.1 hypothetical protein [Candidatus Scalindua rubra]
MLGKSQNQNIDDNSKGLQGGRDAIDNSTTNNYYAIDKQERKDFGIIGEIFEFLFKENIVESDFTELSNGEGLKKIPLNFSGDSLQTVNEMALKTTQKRDLVKKFVNSQRETDESKIDGLIIKLQKDFRTLKNSENNYEKIENVNIIEQMSVHCIEESKRENPDFNMNALAIVLYFFEMCDFGKSVKARAIKEAIF